MDKTERDFRQFHADYSAIYDLFCKYTLQAIKAGQKNYSARAIFHRIRWFTQIETRMDHKFKINNNYSPYYARMFARDYPAHKDFFRFREANADHVPLPVVP